MSINIKTTIITLTLTLLFSCTTKKLDDSVLSMQATHEFTFAPLIGVIYDTNKQPCTDVLVSLTESPMDTVVTDDEEVIEDEIVSSVKSDINGRFMLPVLYKGINTIKVQKPGYEDAEITFDFSDATQVFYISIISIGSLLDEAEKFIDSKNLELAENRINRALIIDEKSEEALFLKAVCDKLKL